VFVAALDQTMVLTLMQEIMVSLGIDVEHIGDAGWIITGYLLGYTIAMPLFGRLTMCKGADPWPSWPLPCSVGSLGCVLLSRFDLFVVARVVQALAAAHWCPSPWLRCRHVSFERRAWSWESSGERPRPVVSWDLFTEWA